MFLSLDLHETYTRYWSYEMLVARTIWGQRVKGQGHRGHSTILSCQLRGSVVFWPIWFILGTNIVHDMMMCRVPFLGQKVKGQGHTGHFKWRSQASFEVFAVSAPWLRTYWTDSLHMWYTHNSWGDNVSRTNSGSKGQRSRSQGSFEVLAVSAPWLHPYWTDSLHMWYTHNPWGDDVSRTISGSKGQRSRS